MKKKILFMGTPFFASEILGYLLQHHDIEVIGVVSQPDRKLSRKKQIEFSPVKTLAIEHKLPLFQPLRVKDFVVELKELNPDAIITCAYGQFLPQSILDFNVINIHASLLPAYRGGAPMQYAIMKGEKTTGISLMKSVLKMDAGPVYSQKEVEISDDDTLSSLEIKLIHASKRLCDESLLDILNGQCEPIEQDSTKVSVAYTIKSEDEYIDFQRSTQDVYNHLRALIEQPCGYNFINSKRIKFTEVKKGRTNSAYPANTVLFDQKDYFEVFTNDGSILVTECQLEGKPRMKASQLYNGYHQTFHMRSLNDQD